MNNQDTAPRRPATNSANQVEAVSRRQLLASGAAAAAIATLPTLAGASGVGSEGDGTRTEYPTHEQRRLAAALSRYGPELGPRR